MRSPSNQLPGPASLACRSKQRDFLAAGVSLVEIDLVRAGEWAFSVDEADETGRYDHTDYRRPLKPPLAPKDAGPAADLLRKVGRS